MCFFTAECTTKMLDSSKLVPATCTSVNGYMTAWLPNSSNRRQLSESDVYTAIEDFISKSYSSESIIGVSYIPPANTESATTSPQTEGVVTGSRAANIFQDSSSSPTWEIGPGFGLLALIVSLLALVGIVRIVKNRKSKSKSSLSPSVAAIEPEVSGEIASEPPTPIAKGGLRRHLSDETEDCSVATEDYTPNDYTQDEFIKRMPTYGSAWGDRTRTMQSEAVSTVVSTVVGVSDEDASLPSEMGEEIGIDGLL